MVINDKVIMVIKSVESESSGNLNVNDKKKKIGEL